MTASTVSSTFGYCSNRVPTGFQQGSNRVHIHHFAPLPCFFRHMIKRNHVSTAPAFRDSKSSSDSKQPTSHWLTLLLLLLLLLADDAAADDAAAAVFAAVNKLTDLAKGGMTVYDSPC